MSNHRTIYRTTTLGRPMDNEFTAARHAGYEDARQGLPFRREYEGWRHTMQLNYELGRAQAIAAHVRVGGTEKDLLHNRSPKWPRNRRMSPMLRAGGVPPLAPLVDARTFQDMTGSAYARWFV